MNQEKNKSDSSVNDSGIELAARPSFLPVVGTLTEYIREAMSRAIFEDLDEEGWYGEIPDLRGVWANAPTSKTCQIELQSTLEDWLLFGLANNFPIPSLNGTDVTVHRVA